MIAFKIMEFENGQVKTLFHGIDGSRTVPCNTWVKSEQKQVKDGTSKTTYESGWHILPTEESCHEYMGKFKNRLEKLVIVKCEVAGRIWDKAHSPSPVQLAEEIKVLEIVD